MKGAASMSGFFRTLVARADECPPGCTLCADACADVKANRKGRIFPLNLTENGGTRLVKCNQCSEPSCAEICPTRAISRDEVQGVVVIDEDKCVGCGMCSLGCPYGGIHFGSGDEKPGKCDHCGGRPACVEACTFGVLEYSNARSVLDRIGEDILSHGRPLCSGCGQELGIRMALRALGRDVALFVGPGCGIVSIMGNTRGVPVTVPVFGCCMTNVPSCMTGATRYFQKKGRDVTCVALVGDGLTADIGFQALSGAAERNERILYICFDNEAYMNTGIQRSGTTPRNSWTSTTQLGEASRGKSTKAKNIPLLMAFHGISYVATASIAFLDDYIEKISRAREATTRGMAYLHVLVPCATGWRAPESSTIKLSRLAVETNYFPLWEAEERSFRFTHLPKKKKPVEDFTRLMGRFSHLTKQEIEKFQSVVDEEFKLIGSLTGLSR